MDKNRIIEEYLQGKHPIEQESWELPSAQELERDEALYDSLMAERKAPKRIRLWPWMGAVAASIVLLLAFHFTQKPVEGQPVVAEVEEPEVVEQVFPQPVIAEPAPEPIAEEKQQEPIKLHKAHKPHKPQEPKEESLLAEVETTEEAPIEIIQQRHIDSSNPYLLATAQLQDLRSRGERLDREVAMLMQH